MNKKPIRKQADEATPAPAGNLLALAEMMTPEKREQARLERERKETDRLEREKRDAAYEARCYRLLERFERWAKKQPHDELAETFSLALLLLIERGKTARVIRKSHDVLERLLDRESMRAEATESVARDYVHRFIREKRARQQGGKAKADNSPSARAKDAARALWPEANRKGWTATQFHTTLIKRGHRIAFDTARKWMTTLRKAGTC